MHPDSPPLGRLRIVLVEDCPADTELLQLQLEEGGLDFVLVRVEDADGLRAALGQGADIVLSDVSLPRFSGYEALELVRRHDRLLPFVFFSGTIDETMAVEALQGGANDYVLKDNPVRLPSAIARAVREARMARERDRAEKELMRSQRLESLALLAAGLSHDLRNVLQPLLIVPELMEEYSDDPRIRRLAALVTECGRRGHEMAESMLSFARGSRASSETMTVEALFESVRLLLQGSLPRGARLEFAPAEPDLCVQGNRTELQQCLINLGLNALQAMAPNGGTVRIEAQATRDADGTAWTCLRVVDDGPGIDAESLGRLFTPFFTTKPEGTGLGLLSCKRIVETRGGRIAVDSVVGTGTTVSLWFPLREEPEPEWAPHVAWREGSGECVLVAGGETARLSLLANALASQGYDVAVARDAHAACARLERAPAPALLLLDSDTWAGGADELRQAMQRSGFAGRVILLEGTHLRQGQLQDDPRLFALLTAPVQMGDVFDAVEAALGAVEPRPPAVAGAAA
jgi:signal transduction histidine kinase